MVRAILEDRKTQTRRIVRPQPEFTGASGDSFEWHGGPVLQRAGYGAPYVHTDRRAMEKAMERCNPYGQPGDRLWVRETWYCDNCFAGDYEASLKCVRHPHSRAQCEAEWKQLLYYRADAKNGTCCELIPECECEGRSPWKPSIHMPRWASRLTLEITGIGVQRLTEINERDADWEGTTCHYNCTEPTHLVDGIHRCQPIEDFRDVWNKTNEAKGFGWSANPWVWVIQFKRL
jgi:hypothetical protein